MDQATLIRLLQKHFDGVIESEEAMQLHQWFKDVSAADFHQTMDALQPHLPAAFAGEQQINAAFQQRLEQQVDALEASENKTPARVHRIHFLKTAWFRYAAAIIILFGAGTYWYINRQQEKPSVTTNNNPVPVKNDVAPGGNRATLILADGSTINLDSAAAGELARQRRTIITKTADGSITYKALAATDPESVQMNTMTTPRGGQYQLTLPDGSQVWLNAESSITYPTTFAGTERERRVTITGEAYFEVAKDKTKPFIVTVSPADLSPASGDARRPAQLSPAGGGVREANGGGLEIQVLGTHFNINAYKEEATINTTLLEGSVRVSLSPHRSPLSNAVHTSLTLKPGQQGQYNPRNENLSLAVSPDVEQVIAWKNGLFHFESADLQTILRQFARWYDIDVKYEGHISNEKYLVIMKRNATLASVLKSLQSNNIKFRIEGKTLYVQSS